MAELSEHANALAEGIVRALPAWVERSVDRIYRAWAGAPPPEVMAAARTAGANAAADIGGKIRALLNADIDDQRSTPLTLIRAAVIYPTIVLSDAGVPDVVRDGEDERMFPKDVYGLTPATFADVDPGLAELGLAWGAAKAWTHKERHR